MPKVAPSILSADFTRLGEVLREVEKAGIDTLHLDVMDGHFVPNISFGALIVDAVRRCVPGMELNTHLMIKEPLRYAEQFTKAGASRLVVHREITDDPARLCSEVKAISGKVGLSYNPETPIDGFEELEGIADMILIMSVHPGFGGQKFIQEVLTKVKKIVKFNQSAREKFTISIDGGINPETAPLAIEAGVDNLVAGNAFFKNKGEYRTSGFEQVISSLLGK
ncbi:ribulose-phosphate 3-epimerase [bacterium]|nr:ribulose-phosphate 3-epimerase [bacterium]